MLNFLLWLLTTIASCIAPSPPPASSCEVELTLQRIDEDADQGPGAVELVAWATNVSLAPVTFSFERPCPDGPARFTGWDYDFYGTCGDGVCAPMAPIETVELAPGEAVAISHLFDDPPRVDFGGNECNVPVPLGTEVEVSYTVTGVSGATVCGPNTTVIAHL